MPSIVNISAWDGVLSNSFFPIAATTPGNSLAVAVSYFAGGADAISIDTNAGDSFPNLPFGNDPGAMNTSGGENGTAIYFLPACVGVATQMRIHGGSSTAVWVFEMTPTQLVIGAINSDEIIGGGPQMLAIGPTVAGAAPQNIYIACMTGDVALSVNSPWTFDPAGPVSTFFSGFGAAHFSGSGNETPIFTQASANRFSVSAAVFGPGGGSVGPPPPPPPSSGTAKAYPWVS